MKQIENLEKCLKAYEGSGGGYCETPPLFGIGEKRTKFINTKEEAAEQEEYLDRYYEQLLKALDDLKKHNAEKEKPTSESSRQEKEDDPPLKDQNLMPPIPAYPSKSPGLTTYNQDRLGRWLNFFDRLLFK